MVATAAVELGLGLVAGFGGVVAWCEIGVRLADDFPVSLDVAFAVTDDFFADVCRPLLEAGRSVTVAEFPFRLAKLSPFSAILALSERSVSPFTLVTFSTLNWDIISPEH